MFKNRGNFINNWQEHSPVLFSSSGMLCAILVVLEMCEKLFDDSAKNWSPIRLLGPQVWIPVVTDKGQLVAVHMMIYSFMYFLVCGNLLKAQQERKVKLVIPWFVMHCVLLVYQIMLMVVNREFYGRTDIVVAICFSVLNALLLVSALFTMRRWYYHPEKAYSWHGSACEWEQHNVDSGSSDGGSVRKLSKAKRFSRAKRQPKQGLEMEEEPETEPEEFTSD